MKQIIERLNDLQEIILEPDFTNKKGLGGEIGFYIFDYDAADELIVRQAIPDLIQYSKKRNEALRFQVFDLYDMMIRFFEKRGIHRKKTSKWNSRSPAKNCSVSCVKPSKSQPIGMYSCRPSGKSWSRERSFSSQVSVKSIRFCAHMYY